MDIELKIAQLNRQILETKMTQPSNYIQIRKLQMELDKLYEDKSNTNKHIR